MTTESERPAESTRTYREDIEDDQERVVPPERVSWGAIFAGTALALGLAMVLGMLGAAIGLEAFNPAEESDPLSGYGVGTGLWLGLQILVSLFVGGWVAGRLAGKPRGLDGTLNGAVVWALTLILGLLGVAGLTSAVVSGAVSAVETGAQAAGSAVGGVVSQVDPQVERSQAVGVIQRQGERLLSQTQKEELQPEELEQEARALEQLAIETGEDVARSPQQAEQIISQAISRTFSRLDGVVEDADREALVNILVARTEMNRQQAQRTVDQWATTYEDAISGIEEAAGDIGGTAETVAADVSDAAATALWWTLLASLLGLVAACVGGWLGSPKLEAWQQRRRRTYYGGRREPTTPG
ncbi:MAG: TIGR04086 family membrane protein [Persicimonas sp.]